MSSPVKTDQVTPSSNPSTQDGNTLDSDSMPHSIAIAMPCHRHVLEPYEGQCIQLPRETWPTLQGRGDKNAQDTVYVQGPPPNTAYQGNPPGGYYAQPPPPRGYYVVQAPVYAPPPPENVGRDGSTHRPGRGQRVVVDDDDEAFGNSFSDKYVRARFVRKVYTLLMIQLLITSSFIAFFVLYGPANRFVKKHWWLVWLSLPIFIVSYCAIMCCRSVSRNFPCNIIALSALTLSLSFITACISAAYDTYIVLMAFGTTAILCLLISIIACQPWCDITGWGLYLCVASLVVFMFGIIAGIVTAFTNFKLLNVIYAGLIALLFSMYLMYDTQQIMGGRKVEISPEEPIYAVTLLYIDIIYIFTAFLTLCNN